MEHIISVNEDELIYMIIRSKEINNKFHKIISKVNTEGKIEASSVLENSENKHVENFEADNREDFLRKCSQVIADVKIDNKEFDDLKFDYDDLDLSDIKDIKEQLKVIRNNPDDFSRWDTTGKPRKIKTNNPFLMDK